jgi:hypothetical protein
MTKLRTTVFMTLAAAMLTLASCKDKDKADGDTNVDAMTQTDNAGDSESDASVVETDTVPANSKTEDSLEAQPAP